MLRRRWAAPAPRRASLRCACRARVHSAAPAPPCAATPPAARVRFAPSPTGELHLGGLRTALYNYLLARGTGGSFVLRVEDTDRARLVPGAAERLQAALDWAGLAPDEGLARGGPHAPYTQSQRLPLYRDAAEALLRRGAAYRCFCTPEQLAASRHGGAQQFMYDGCCRAIPPAESAARAETEPHAIRLAVPRGPIGGVTDHYGGWRGSSAIVVEDAVRGRVAFESASVDDAVLLKSDGRPSYHLASVVDDHAMAITHVVRGEEWLSSTPKHELLYRAMGWAPPLWAHLPLLLDAAGGKLSKRSGSATPVAELQRLGYLPSAVLHYVALCGWAPAEAEAEQVEGSADTVLTMDALCAAFDLGRVGRAAARLDPAKLDVLNGRHLREQLARWDGEAGGGEGCEALLATLRAVLAADVSRGASAGGGFGNAPGFEPNRSLVPLPHQLDDDHAERASAGADEPEPISPADVATHSRSSLDGAAEARLQELFARRQLDTMLTPDADTPAALDNAAPGAPAEGARPAGGGLAIRGGRGAAAQEVLPAAIASLPAAGRGPAAVGRALAAGELDGYVLAVARLLQKHASGPLTAWAPRTRCFFGPLERAPALVCDEELRPTVAEAMRTAAGSIEQLDGRCSSAEGMKAALNGALEGAAGLKRKHLWPQVRMAATGEGSGADLMGALALLGPGCVAARLRRGAALLAEPRPE